MCRLTKLLLKAVLVLFCGKSSIFQFIRTLLSMGEFSAHQSLNGPPFVAVPSFAYLWLSILSISIFRSTTDGWDAVKPTVSFFKLTGQPKQGGLIPVTANKMHANR